jgi:hypothetical protein
MAINFSTSEGYLTRFQYGIAQGSRILGGTADAITMQPGATLYLVGSNYFITGSAIDNITLVLPLAGGGFGGGSGGTFPGLLGQDGMELTIISKTAFAHTITTPTNGINGNKHIATFSATIGNNIHLLADAGVWWMVSQIGVTLS